MDSRDSAWIVHCMYPTPLFMGLFCFGGGWWFLGGRAEWTDRRLPIIGGRARPWWRGGGEKGETVCCMVSWIILCNFSRCWGYKYIKFYPTYPLTLAQLILLFVYWLTRPLLWYVRIYVFSSLSPPQPCLPSLLLSQSHRTLAAVQHLALLPLAAWRTNSRSFLQGLQTTQ